jgi:23S rRNA (uracil1939-C5)-methyltransferase
MRSPYTEQLEQKRERVCRGVARYPQLAPLAVLPVEAADPRTAYRTRAKLMVAEDGRVGLFGVSGDHEVVDSPGCIVLAPALARVTAALRTMIARSPVAAEGSPSLLSPAEDGLVAVDLRELRPSSESEAARVLVTWVVRRGVSFRLERCREAAARLRQMAPEVLGVAVNFHEGEGPQVLGKETLLVAGKGWGEDALGGSTHRAAFGSFVQAHRGQAARVHAKIIEAVFAGASSRPPRVLDLYGGSGAIALALAARGARVRLVESFAPAVEQAQASARAAGLGLEAVCGDVAEVLTRLGAHEGAFDAAVVNPPRRGVDPVVRARLAELGLRTVVYVSCQPETLARDLAHLARLGLAAVELAPLDMIPLTFEVETVAVLAPGEPPPPVVLYEDADVIVVDKSSHEPTTPQGEHRSSLLARVQRLRGGAEAVPVHRLDAGTSGVVVFARDPSRVAAWSRALAADDARKMYTAAVRGVPDARGAIDRPLVIDGKKKSAHTAFERESLLGQHAILRVLPDEGRTHQIRRHLAALGHPVLGDDRYGHAATNRFFFERHGLDRTFLHAARLELRHPVTGKRVVIEAPLPGDLQSVVDSVKEGRAGAPIGEASVGDW